MEDINNALLHIKSKHNGEIPYQYGSRECAKLMDSYAKEYYERQLKLLGIADVVGRSEQLSKRPNTSSTLECFTKSEKQRNNFIQVHNQRKS